MSATWTQLASWGSRNLAARKYLLGAAIVLAVALGAGTVAMVRLAASQPGGDLDGAWLDAASSRTPVVQCMEAAVMVHDVRWAVACSSQAELDGARHAACLLDPVDKGDPEGVRARCDRVIGPIDGSAECHLPDERAASLNALLQDSERQCRTESPGAGR